MRTEIRKQIEEEAKKRIRSYNKKIFYYKKYVDRRRKRTGKESSKRVFLIDYRGGEEKGRLYDDGKKIFISSSSDKHFNPHYCIKHSKFLAKGLYTSLMNRTYCPRPTLRIRKRKPQGGCRNIDIFSIPDAAVSKVIFNKVRKRNENRLSDSSFAYFSDRTPLDGVLRLKSLLNIDKIFVSKYDFSDYFSSIDHDILMSLLVGKGKFLVTSLERNFIRSLIKHEYKFYGENTVYTNNIGIPQGNSMSAFIANIFADSLDSDLRALRGEFVRYADDSIVINESYEDAIKCYNAYKKFSREKKININFKKFSGICLYSSIDDELKTMEMRSMKEIQFLGYVIRGGVLDISLKSIKNIKSDLFKIMYNNMILHPKKDGILSKRRIGKGFVDWDIVTCINEIRKKIYGKYSERDIVDFINGRRNINRFYNKISYFCLSENVGTLKALDGWLASTLYKLYNERVLLLKQYNLRPVEISRNELINGKWYQYNEINNETKLPSFYLAWQAAKRSWKLRGLHGVTTEYDYSINQDDLENLLKSIKPS